ncbi:MAG: helix-turn-helix transcriptional regulator [Bacteroidota bacterium]
MNLTHQNSRIIFGLKVKQLRVDQGLSFANLSKAAGMSVSYLNEIEKGKKSPKADKIETLANALGTTYEELVSPDLTGKLAAVGELLHSNFLNELPLDLFGIDLSKVVEIIANAPLRVGAFISTLVELSRNFELKEENFYFNAVRAYQELHYNYFEKIEQSIAKFIEDYKLPANRAVPVNLLASILKKHFGYHIVENDLAAYPELQHLRSIFIPKKKKLILNPQLNEKQKALQLGKELAYNYLKLKERINTSSFLKVNNFQIVLNNYIAGYFAVGLLVQRPSFVKDLAYFFNQTTWDKSYLLQLLLKYDVSPEVLFQRFNLLPQDFKMPKLFFMRMIHNPNTNSFQIDKELHLNRQHEPHANNLDEHYCRRWLSISQLQQLADNRHTSSQVQVGVQLSKYPETGDEYFCFTIARPAYFPSKKNVSVTIGLLADEELKTKIKFLEDQSIPRKEVSVTCERCPIMDCQERISPPTVIQNRERQLRMETALEKLVLRQKL